MKKIIKFLLVGIFLILVIGFTNPINASEVNVSSQIEEEIIVNEKTGIIAENDVLISSSNFPAIGYTFTYNGKVYSVENYAYSLPYSYFSGGTKSYYVCSDPNNKYFMIRVPDSDTNFSNDFIIEKIDNAGSPWRSSTCILPYVKSQPYIYSFQSYQSNESYDYYFYYSPTKIYNIGHRSEDKQYMSFERLDGLYGSTYKFNDGARYINLDKLNTTIGNKNNMNNIDDAFYFENLTNNFGNNINGSCSYISIAMLLGYYDSLIDDRFVNNGYLDTTYIYPTAVYSHDLADVESPGTTEAYHQYLLGIGQSLGLGYGIYSSDFLPLFNETIEGRNNVTVDYLLNYNHEMLGNNNALTNEQIEYGVKNHIDNNNPVILLLSEWEYNTYSYRSDGSIVINSNVSYSYLGHAMIAYGYVTYNGETYYKCHMGWHAPTTDVLVKINGGEVSAVAMEYFDDGNHQCSKAYLYDLDASLEPMCFCPTALETAKFVHQPFSSQIDCLSFETTEDSQLYSISFSTNFEVDLYVNGELITITDVDYSAEYLYDYQVIVNCEEAGTQRIILHSKNYYETNLTYAIYIEEYQIDESKIIDSFYDMAAMEYIDGFDISFEVDQIDVGSRTIIFESISLEITATPDDWFYNDYIVDIGIGVISGQTYSNINNCLIIFLYRGSSNLFAGSEYNIEILYSYYDFIEII